MTSKINLRSPYIFHAGNGTFGTFGVIESRFVVLVDLFKPVVVVLTLLQGQRLSFPEDHGKEKYR